MVPTFGILTAFLAFLAWGFGDFTIQRSVRRIGSLQTLFAIAGFGAVGLLPFAWDNIGSALSDFRTFGLLGVTVGVTLLAAIFDFAALRAGKLAVVEPVMSFELVFTVAIGVFFLQERVSAGQLALIAGVFLGIVLAVYRERPWWQFWRPRRLLERGVLLAALGVVAMSLTNVFTGLTSQATGPLTTIWFIHTALALIVAAWFAGRGQIRELFRWPRGSWPIVAPAAILDNVAWVSYSAAVTVLPISITIGITESYVALAAMLGLAFNRERLQRHQAVGMVVALAAAIALAFASA